MSDKAIDIVVTWPKTRVFESYLKALREARMSGQLINYRVAHRPVWKFGALADRSARCYRVHTGLVRGWVTIVYAMRRDEGEVQRVGTDEFWPAGDYIVCNSAWHPIDPIPMKGFQGWRWFDENEARHEEEE